MNAWNDLIASFPTTHILQTQEWGAVKARYGWQAFFLHWRPEGDSRGRTFSSTAGSGGAGADLVFPPRSETAAAALCLIRQVQIRGIKTPLSIAYIPKGPLLDWGDAALRARVLQDIAQFGLEHRVLFVKIDPDVQLGTGEPGTPDASTNPLGLAVQNELQAGGWVFSEEQVQFRNTVYINLEPAEDELLAQMKQKTRYNIRLASRKGVAVRVGGVDDLELLYRLYAETAVRDGFVIRERGYYETVWTTFLAAGQRDDARRPSALPLIAEVEGRPVAAVMIFRFGPTAWFLYGMSAEEHREKMPNYLLQWEAIKLAKASGCQAYDMWGAPDDFNPEDPLWGVYRFKDGFQGTVVRHLGAWDLPLQPIMFRLYNSILPQVLALMRRRGRADTQQAIGAI